MNRLFAGECAWHGACYGIAPEVVLTTKGLLAGIIGLAAPLVAVSGLAPDTASPVLLALGAILALGLSRSPSGDTPRRPR